MSKSLLVIDDDQYVAEVILGIVGSFFDEAQALYNVDSAIKSITEKKFDLIILDINLEGRNGAEILKFIVEDTKNPNKDTPFVISSGIINQTFIEKHHERFAGIIIKPFEHQDLKDLVETIILNKSPIKPEINFGDLPVTTFIKPFNIPQIENKVSKVMEQVKKNPKLKEILQNLKFDRVNDNYFLEQTGMIINISTAICIGLEWSTEKTLEKFVYAAYMHDMALYEKPELAKILTFEDLEAKKPNLSKADYDLVFNHPNIAAKEAESMPSVPPDVGTIIRQHHETPKERGFPNKIGQTKISPLSAIFIVAHDLANFIYNNPNWTMEKYIMRFKMKFKGPHFIKVQQILEKIK